MSSNGWPTVPLGEVVSHRKEFIQIDDLSRYKRCRVQLHGQGVVLRDQIEGALIKTKKQQVCRTNEFLVAEIDAKMGGFGLVPAELEGAVVSSHYFLFTPLLDRLDPQFLGYYCRTPAFRDQVESRGSTNYAAIRPAHVLGYTIPLPPLEEQQRIVSRIDRLAAKIEEARALSTMCNNEHPFVWPAFLGQQFRALATHFPPKQLKELATTITDGPHKTPVYVDDGIPFVTVQNMVSGTLDFTGLKYITAEDHLEISRRCKPEEGDVLYSKDGATRGHPCFVDTERVFNIFVSVALIKPKRDLLDGKYLCHVLRSQWIRDHMLEKSRGDMIPHIVLREIRAFPIPAPPLDVQQRIASRLDELHIQFRDLHKQHTAARKGIDALLPSILDRAFKGEL